MFTTPGALLFIVLVALLTGRFFICSTSASNNVIDVNEIEIIRDSKTDDDILNCSSFEMFSPGSALTAYYPARPGDLGDGHTFVDSHGQKLRTLQEFLANRSPYVTVSMDANLHLPYGTPICIASINRHFGRHINFEIRDINEDLEDAGLAQIEICVQTEADSYKDIVNMDHVELFI